jgi:hypothetical protein
MSYDSGGISLVDGDEQSPNVAVATIEIATADE